MVGRWKEVVWPTLGNIPVYALRDEKKHTKNLGTTGDLPETLQNPGSECYCYINPVGLNQHYLNII
jgi:hypothetical protein